MSRFFIPAAMRQVRGKASIDPGTSKRSRELPPGAIRATPDELANPVDATSDEDQQVLAKVARMRSWADKLGFRNAVQALDHFMGATGEFVEIPADKVDSVRKEAEALHKEKLLKAVQDRFGARGMLALKALVDPSGKALPEAQWPAKTSFEMDYASGFEKAGISDDNLAYYASTIKSVVTISAVRKPGLREYELSITAWRSWVVDNYDWEGDKKFGGDNPLFRAILPTQRQMNQLTKIGKAKSYQRSSVSWQMPYSVPAWIAPFEDDTKLQGTARNRQTKIRDRKKEDEENLADGALPDPGPAEDMKSKK